MAHRRSLQIEQVLAIYLYSSVRSCHDTVPLLFHRERSIAQRWQTASHRGVPCSSTVQPTTNSSVYAAMHLMTTVTR